MRSTDMSDRLCVSTSSLYNLGRSHADCFVRNIVLSAVGRVPETYMYWLQIIQIACFGSKQFKESDC